MSIAEKESMFHDFGWKILTESSIIQINILSVIEVTRCSLLRGESSSVVGEGGDESTNNQPVNQFEG